MKNVYLIFSFTGTYFSTFLKFMSGEKYIHVSLAFDKDLKEVYSFGRHNPRWAFPCGFSEENARCALRPLVTGNAEAVMDMGAAKALTGPVSRGDYETVEKHMKVLDGEELEIYRLLSQRLLDMTGDKNASEYMKVKGVLLK